MASTNKSTSTQILDVLTKNSELTVYGIAKKSKLSSQRVAYTIPKLVASGLVLAKTNGENTVYSLQKIHVDKQLIHSLLELLEPLIDKINTQLDLQQAEDPEEALGNNLAYFIARKVIDFR